MDSPTPDAAKEAKVAALPAELGVALSGGGHRASLFGLGALMYLADVGKNRDVCCVSSVSGGSLTNAYVAQSANFRAMTGPQFESLVRPFVCRVAHRGTLWGWCGTWLYLAAVVVSLIVLALVFVSAWPWPLRLVAFLALLLVSASLIWSKRGHVCGRAYAATIFSAAGRPRRLAEIEKTAIDHVICATELHFGEHIYFSGNFVYSFRFGWGKPGDMPLHVAAQVSSAFPGGFPPRWLPTARHQFQINKLKDHGWGPLPKKMALIDGGVYDNMADQWLTGMAARLQRDPGPSHNIQAPQEIVVVNASGNLPYSNLTTLRIPLAGELFAFLRIIDTLYDNTTTTRRKTAVKEFDEAQKTGSGLRGALVMIEQTPFRVAEAMIKKSTDPAQVDRAKALVAELDKDPAARADWKAVTERNVAVATTLRSLGTACSADLLWHGYMVAMANLHVVLGYPLPPVIPKYTRFEQLAAKC